MQTKTKRNLARKCELGSGGGEKSRGKRQKSKRKDKKRKIRSCHKNKNKK